MRCFSCGRVMILIERWDGSDCCGRSILLEPVCMTCEATHAVGSGREIDLRSGSILVPLVTIASRPKVTG